MIGKEQKTKKFISVFFPVVLALYPLRHIWLKKGCGW